MNLFAAKLFLVVPLLLMQPLGVSAESYPVKPIRLIVPSEAGSPPDIRARWLADRLRPILMQPVIVDNRPGAAGIIGTQVAARSPSDGYTLVLVHQGTLVLNPHLYPDLPYDPLEDLAPISRLAISPMLLAVHPGVPADSVAELLTLARRRPGQLTFGSPGQGSPPHMAGELFRRSAHIDVLHVPYRGAPAAQVDLIGGNLTYTFGGIAMDMPQVRGGKIKALAVNSSKRVASLPNIPTVAESGLPGYEYWAWMGICVPSATPSPVVDRLHAAVSKILASTEARDWFAAQGGEPVVETPEEFGAFIRTEHARWGALIRQAGIKLE
jgi:tripartite-type tricarboxylate transporter receptor subunit TctC